LGARKFGVSRRCSSTVGRAQRGVLVHCLTVLLEHRVVTRHSVDGHNVVVKSNEVDKSEGGQVLLKLCGLRKWMVMFNLLVFICYIMFCVCESL